jgi:acetyl-CoA carboxylase carboxyl transferase subunit beta
MANGWFRKRKNPQPPAGSSTPNDASEGLWIQCDACKKLLFKREWERNLKVCHLCGHHFRLTAWERLELLLDPDSFVEQDDDLVSSNPLDFPGYWETLERHRKASGLADAILSGDGLLEGHPLTVAVTDAHFMRGAMGSVVGERLTRAVERATERGVPTLLVSGSGGGARMQEGILSLMQMARTSAAIARHHQAGLLALVLLTDPSLAGIMASWGSLGDVILAEPGAMIGFVGQRVSQQAQVSKVPSNFQTAEFQLQHGQVDRVVPRKDLKETIATLFRFVGAPVHQPVEEARDRETVDAT